MIPSLQKVRLILQTLEMTMQILKELKIVHYLWIFTKVQNSKTYVMAKAQMVTCMEAWVIGGCLTGPKD